MPLSAAVNNSVEPDACPAYQYRGRVATGATFFVIYAIICVVALAGNSFIIGLLARQPRAIQRRTFRFLTVALSWCELIEAVLLLMLLFRIGVGYHNRTTGHRLISVHWHAETENGFDLRRVTLLRLVLSLRDFAIGAEIYIYGLLAVDRLLAIAQPTSTRWSCRTVRLITAAGLVAMAIAEISLQAWRWVRVLGAESQMIACEVMATYSRVNTVTKALVSVANYLLSLGAYAGTAALLVMRARSAPPGQSRQRQGGSLEQTRRPLLGLVLGNLVQFVSLLPMVVDNVLSTGMEFTLYYCFFVSSAAVPCITVAFNSGLRRALPKFARACYSCGAGARTEWRNSAPVAAAAVDSADRQKAALGREGGEDSKGTGAVTGGQLFVDFN